MDILNAVISDMEKEDVRYYKLFANRMYYSHDRKDLQLFDDIYQGGDQFNEEKTMNRLYHRGDRNSFYRLKHRLLNHVNKSLLLQYSDTDEAINILSQVSLYKFHFSRNNYKAAKYFLEKAEKKALAIEFMELLDIIYSEFIRLSIETMDFDPKRFIEKRKINLEKLQRIREIDQVLAAVSYQLKISQNYSPEGKSFITMLERMVKEHSADKELRSGKLLQLKLTDAVSRILIQKHDFKTLESYLAAKLKEFRKKNLFSKVNHESYLKMLTYLVNATFKNKKFPQSLEYTIQLEQAMEAYDRVYFDKYFVFYMNAQVINYSVIDPEKAILLLEDLKKSKMRQKLSFYEIFMYLNLALLYFEKKDYDRSIRQMIDLNMLESFKKADEVLKLKIAVAELMIRYELKDYDVIEYRIGQIQRSFRMPLLNKNQRAESEMLYILRNLIQNFTRHRKEKLLQAMTQFIKAHSRTIADDSSLIKYAPWVQEKFKMVSTSSPL